MKISRDNLPHADLGHIGTGEMILPVTPGEVLHREFMAPHGLSVNALAVALRVPVERIEGIVCRGRAISPETTLRLARYFGTSAEFWARLQAFHALRVARASVGMAVDNEVQPLTA